MKRELKFKVWNIEEKRWNNPTILEVFTDKGTLEPFMYIESGKLNSIYVPQENYVVLQFTGAHDSNKIDIYEDDLLKFSCKDVIGRVVWDNQRYMWLVLLVNCGREELSLFDVLTSIGWQECEVIGNINSTPEKILQFEPLINT